MPHFQFLSTILLFTLALVGCADTMSTSTRPSVAPTVPIRSTTGAPTDASPPTIAPTIIPAQATVSATQPTLTPAPVPQSTTGSTASFIWTRLDTSASPPARYDHALAFDSDKRQLVLFGGRAGEQVMGDTWLYDLQTKEWREIKTAGPLPRFGLASVYDPVSRAVYLFGGQKQDFFNDTWKFDTGTETWTEIVTPDPKPDIRYGHGVTLDTRNHRLVISHGFARDGRHDDTWALDLDTKTWAELTPSGSKPLKRCLHDIAYAPTTDTVYLFGGCSSGFGPCPQGDLWSLDLTTNQWTMASPAGEIPSARENPSIVINSNTGNLILFGGKSDGAVNDLWMFDPASKTWAQINAQGPTARKSHDAIFDPQDNRMYLFGGNDANGAMNDLWVLEQN